MNSLARQAAGLARRAGISRTEARRAVREATAVK